MTIDDLAAMVADGFERVEGEIGGIKQEISEVNISCKP